MHITFNFQGKTCAANLSNPIDLTIPLRHGEENPNCFWAPFPDFEPVRAGEFVGSTAEGGVVNFFNIRLNPHGNGTHTECVGHIARERYAVRTCLREHHFMAKLISLFPQRLDNGDRVLLKKQFEEQVHTSDEVRALIVRTLPNDALKMRQNWSGSNPPYLHDEAVKYLVSCGIEHLILDLPSVDREEDGGLLLGHRAFWQYPEATRTHCSITEMAFIPNEVKDGVYLLNLQTTAIDLDASPSKVLIYPII